MVSAWDRKTGSLLYQVSTLSSIDTKYILTFIATMMLTQICVQGRPHGKGVSVMGLAVDGNSV